MPVIDSDDFDSGANDGTSIGHDNFVSVTNITSTTEQTGFPVTNLANPATHLKWKGVAGNYVSLIHFDGTDSPAPITDVFGHSWTANGNVFMDTAQSKFGGQSARFDGTTDYYTGDGSADFAFGASNDLTIDFWVRFNAIGTDQRMFDARPNGTISGDYISIEKNTSDKIIVFVQGATKITSTTTVTTGTWYHVALIRSNGSTKLYINGTNEGATFADTVNYLIGTSRPVIGAAGDTTGGSSLNGWIDEFRVLNGTAAHTANFTAPTAAYDPYEYITIDLGGGDVDYIGVAGHNWDGWTVSVEHATNNSPSDFLTSIDATVIDGTTPIMFRFSEVEGPIRIKILPTSGADAPEAAVVYTGDLLQFGRGIKADVEHVPVTYGRRTSVVNGMSENGNFLGRIVLGEHRQTKAEYFGWEKDFYVSNIDEFLASAQEVPFFFAYAAQEYPLEVGYVWLVNNAEPQIRPDTHVRAVSLTLEMRGVA